MALEYLTPEQRERVLEEVKEAGKKARRDCDHICHDALSGCSSACYAYSANCKCSIDAISFVLQHGSLRKPERDEGLVKTLEETEKLWLRLLRESGMGQGRCPLCATQHGSCVKCPLYEQKSCCPEWRDAQEAIRNMYQRIAIELKKAKGE